MHAASTHVDCDGVRYVTPLPARAADFTVPVATGAGFCTAPLRCRQALGTPRGSGQARASAAASRRAHGIAAAGSATTASTTPTSTAPTDIPEAPDVRNCPAAPSRLLST